MDLGLSNKVVLITGGSKGIGRAIVEGVAVEGGIPVIVNRPGKEGLELVDLLEKEGSNSLYIEAELSETSECQRVAEKVAETFGRIDVLVNNAGKNDGVGLEKGSPEQFEKSLRNNLSHYFALAHYCLPALKNSKGNILNISSKTAVSGQGGTSGYIASKGAQLALTREWAVELLSYGIRVNAILPAEVWTPLYEQWINSLPDPQSSLNDIKMLIPLENRMTTAEEIADAALFLISQKASHITGQHWYVDGGYTHLDRAIGKLS